MRVSRRAVIGGGAAALGAAGLGLAAVAEPMPEGALGGADLARGHRLRQGKFPPPSRTERVKLLIAGGGVAGLAAGWRLAEAGFTDFRLLELEDRVGGNARAGRNAVSAFPLGAHYLPVPNEEARALRHMLGQFGMVVGEENGRPVYDPFQLTAELEERLFWQGEWQEGLIPRTGVPAEDRRQIAAFEGEMARLRALKGGDGRPAFASPIAYSSRDPALRALDRQPFTAWLDAHGFTAPVLRAHLRYAMRDDYGCEPHHVSAWAGLHYFAGRRGYTARGSEDNQLTWPEGNGRLIRLMAARFADRIAGGRIVHRVTRTSGGMTGGGMTVDHFDVARGETVRTEAEAVILALPHFVAARLSEEIDDAGHSYAPWLVANVTVDRLPHGPGVPLAWDNVSSTSESLGYVVATHQSAGRDGPSVLTWYQPLSREDPAAARRRLLETPAKDWKRYVRDDLLAMNPELEGAIRRIDLWRWGHAMIRPVPDFLWGARPQPDPPLYLAHSDVSGLSLFEEAHYQGVRAAEAAMARLGHRFESLL
ncbi:MAG: FAD-dependent oxidoreductase [Sphingomonas sp.]|uniref:FAD-dependent oxidoreductase n=1 Tax=Sphingomonas sp. TaxID=28214 RepID=UPI0025D42FD8|nr:FAD-dependent oxidoreductase [Sphingomonas sp.]MBX9880532.1 FAD-dependent oxidoreductase [Sphingomonas sp.]